MKRKQVTWNVAIEKLQNLLMFVHKIRQGGLFGPRNKTYNLPFKYSPVVRKGVFQTDKNLREILFQRALNSRLK